MTYQIGNSPITSPFYPKIDSIVFSASSLTIVTFLEEDICSALVGRLTRERQFKGGSLFTHVSISTNVAGTLRQTTIS